MGVRAQIKEVKMKKIFLSIVMISLFTVSMFWGSAIASTKSTPIVSGFYRSDHSKGIAYTGPNYLTSYGYRQYVRENSSFSSFCTDLRYNDIIFVNSHGDAGQVTLSNDRTGFSGNDVSASNITVNARMVYLATCYGANTSSTYGNVCLELYRKGVDVVVGFKEALSAPNSALETGGIHRFNMLFLYNFTDGYNVRISLDMAVEQIVDETGLDWGGASYYLLGYQTMTF